MEKDTEQLNGNGSSADRENELFNEVNEKVQGDTHVDSPKENTTSPQVFKHQNKGLFYRPQFYERGFKFGLIGADSENLEKFIEFREKQLEAEDKINRLQNKERTLEQEVTETQSDRQKIASEVMYEEEKISQLERDVIRLNNENNMFDEKIKEQQNAFKSNKTKTTLIGAFILVIASCVFIIAEIGITKEVMENILNMKQPVGSILGFNISETTGGIFGIAIALTAFALKPAYDRIFEQGFLGGKQKVSMFILLGATSLLVFITLYSLGFFRVKGEFEKFNALHNKTEQVNAFPDNEISNDGSVRIDELQKGKGDNDEYLIGHPSVYIVFVLSSVLFALSGAIGFGIALPVFKERIGNWILKEHKITSSRRQKKKNIVSMQNTNEEIATRKKNIAFQTERLKQLPSTENIVDEIKSLRIEISDLIKIYFEYKREAEKAWFQTGIDEGKKYILKGQPIARISDGDQVIHNSDLAPDSNQSNQIRRSTYLHQKLRRLIKYNFQ